MAPNTLLMLLVLSAVTFQLSSIAATSTSLPYEIRTLAEALDLSSEEEVIATYRKLLATTNTPRQTFNVGGALVAIYNYADFTTAVTGGSLTIYNSAAIVAGKLRLVSGLANQRGQAVIASQLFIYNQARAIAGVFGTKFTYQFGGNSRVGCNTLLPSTCPGDGFTVSFSAIQPSAGLAGGNLGYGGITPNSISIEFDVVQNTIVSDPNNNHIGFNAAGSVTSVATATPPIDILNDLRLTNVWIEFWPTGGITTLTQSTLLQFTLRVFIANAKAPKPATAAFTAVADLGPILAAVGQDQLYVGFTAGTGSATSTINIVNWEFFSSVINLVPSVPIA